MTLATALTVLPDVQTTEVVVGEIGRQLFGSTAGVRDAPDRPSREMEE